ncbi:Suppression of tumorigenicity 5 [Trypanosoma grayi]|uniref:Suppression of tumorigenicity 5 n=1 Tax=Trypanosoma grayi TaxID=71804 RepID=UPI0004F47886|nr:Suppression of tumorigenicity 5 [Trypanosoma grayi]KEG15193.1 Suppression of tumorigenicity 5 [Trypanosoma grayi]
MQLDSEVAVHHEHNPNAQIDSGGKETPSMPQLSPHLFSCSGHEGSCLLFFLILRKEGQAVEEVWSYPHTLEFVEAKYPMMTQFVFSSSGTSYSVEDLSHTFVLTDGHGVRVYGHCTVFVNGEAVVSLSPYPWCRFFTRLALLFRTNGYENGKKFVKALYGCPTPPSGGSFQTPSSILVLFQRPYDRLCPFIDTSPLDLLDIFSDTSTLFSVLADLLLEKHIIVVGPNFGIVSHVVMALQTLISPFDWMHILIPILPTSLLEVLAAPPPYLVGILTSQLPLVAKVPIEQYVMIYLGSSGICEGVHYHCEKKHTLPKSGAFSALRIGYSTLKMRDSRGHTVCDLCSLFLTYYASLLGDLGIGGTIIGTFSQHSDKDLSFYEDLRSTQCFTTLVGAVREALADENNMWLDNEFIVALVRGHPCVYPHQYQQLIREENKGGGYAVRYEYCFGGREEFTALSAAVHGFGGHRMGTGRLFCHCLRNMAYRLTHWTEESRVTVTLEDFGSSIGNGQYHSAPLGTPGEDEMHEIPNENGAA